MVSTGFVTKLYARERSRRRVYGIAKYYLFCNSIKLVFREICTYIIVDIFIKKMLKLTNFIVIFILDKLKIINNRYI